MNTSLLFQVQHNWQLLLRKIAENDFSFEQEWKIQLLWEIATIKQKGKGYELSFRNQLPQFQLAVANAARYQRKHVLAMWPNAHLVPVPQVVTVASRVPFVIGDAAWILALMDELVISDLLTISQLRCSLQSYARKGDPVHLPERDAYLQTIRSSLFTASQAYNQKDIEVIDKLFNQWRLNNNSDAPSEFSDMMSRSSKTAQENWNAFLNFLAEKKRPAALEYKQVAEITDRNTCASPSFTQVELIEQITNELEKAQQRQRAVLGSPPLADNNNDTLYDSLTRQLRLLESTSLSIRANHTRSLDGQVSKLLLNLDFGNWVVHQLLPSVHRNHLIRVFSEEAKIDDMNSFIRRSELMAYLEILENCSRRLVQVVIEPLIPVIKAKEQEAARNLQSNLQSLYDAITDFYRLHSAEASAATSSDDTGKLLLERHAEMLRLVNEQWGVSCLSVYANGTTHAVLWDFIQHLIVDTANLKVFTVGGGGSSSSNKKLTDLFPIIETLESMAEKEQKKFGDVTFVEPGNTPNIASAVPRVQPPPKNKLLMISSVVLEKVQSLGRLLLLNANYNTSAWAKSTTPEDSWSRVKAHFDATLVPWIKSLIPFGQYRQFVDLILDPQEGLVSAQHRNAIHPQGQDLRALILQRQTVAVPNPNQNPSPDDASLTPEERQLIEEDPGSLLDALSSSPELTA